MLGKASLDRPGWITPNNCVWLHIFDDYRLGSHDATRSNCYAAHNRAAKANPYVILNDHVPFCGGMPVPIDLPCGKRVVEDVPKRKCCSPVAPVVSSKENRLVFNDRAEAAYEKMRPFAPASYVYVLNAVRVSACKKYPTFLSPLQWLH